jgi:hypothetical protein
MRLDAERLGFSKYGQGITRSLNAAISGSIFADPDACFVMMMALPFGSTRAGAGLIGEKARRGAPE